jgi:hypothetical protein
LYEKVARALKAYDPSLKVGACGLAEGQRESVFREGFISYCADNKVPLDFYSWHHYSGDSNDPYDFTRVARVVRGLLDDNGFLEAENHCSEWNLTVESRDDETVLGGAFICSAMIYMQDDLDLSLYYAGPAGSMGLFEKNGVYRKKAYAFKACGQMLNTPQRLQVEGDDTYGFGVLAGRSADGKMVQVLISNYEIHTPEEPPRQTAAPGSHGLMRRKGIRNGNNRGYELTINNLPWGKGEFTIQRYRITEKENADPLGEITAKGGLAEIKSELPPPGIELVVIRKK